MNRPFRLVTLLAVAAASVVVQVGTAAADDWDCPFPAIDSVYAYPQTPAATLLSGRVDPSPGCPSHAVIGRIDGSEQIAVGDGFFELPLDTRSGDWYLSAYTMGDETRTFEPVAPYVVKVLNLTRITSTAPPMPEPIPYGSIVHVSGVFEGWTAATGWQPMGGRGLSIVTGNGVDGHQPVPTMTDSSGAYSLSVRVYNSFAGGAYFPGDDTWLHAGSFSDVQVHGLVSVDVTDWTPAVGQRILVTGKVAPGAVPVWLERQVGTEWVKVSATVTATGRGHYSLAYRPTTRGLQHYRVWNDGTEPISRMGVQPYSKEFKLAVHR
ncbi:hypothetical protein EV138_5552 [Kribbella voronezhensis]|uniref:Uncharacterized protein n=1 Tax=Kribbella voronezhensis TaxID=2512212 RepID=A0A4R7TIY7_9ACTN|nr:hypothetical protein [Kribbella voronezhensis]TDU91939.1 hypothetical protein EV138_5552 [Kribbella voronezhensis]